MQATILSILMLAGIALSISGLYIIAKKRDPKRGWLMLLAAIVMFGNVAIMVMPAG